MVGKWLNCIAVMMKMKKLAQNEDGYFYFLYSFTGVVHWWNKASDFTPLEQLIRHVSLLHELYV